jgi:tRNA(Ile)-lysidine synthase TilS/MesJ
VSCAPLSDNRYKWDLFLLSIDEGISGYRDDSLETVKRNELQVSCLPARTPYTLCPADQRPRGHCMHYADYRNLRQRTDFGQLRR